MNDKTLERIAIALEAISVVFDATKPEALIIREFQKIAALAIGRLKNELARNKRWVTMNEHSVIYVGDEQFEIQVVISSMGRR